MGKVVSGSFYNRVIATAQANCFPSLLSQFLQLLKTRPIYLLPHRGVSKAPFVLAERLGTPKKAMPRKGRALFVPDSRAPDT